MEPTLSTGFVLFGIPLTLGLLGLFHSGRRLYCVFTRHRDTSARAGQASVESTPEPSSRGLVLRYGTLFVCSALLVAHSGRWLLRIYGLF